MQTYSPPTLYLHKPGPPGVFAVLVLLLLGLGVVLGAAVPVLLLLGLGVKVGTTVGVLGVVGPQPTKRDNTITKAQITAIKRLIFIYFPF